LPKALELSGLDSNALTIAEDLWPSIVRPLGYDAGIRTLNRTIEGITRKTAKLIVENKVQVVNITLANIKDYLPK
ncbi:hypothetical protein KKA49_01600, partial [Patescibacteria group bacterium]|nr:hypothetical protein [Patescibacteria group bacterium]